ncbi:MAG: SDR family NAD(P)-dependent oxidoreductase [Anaerolineae bacterium]
MATTRPMTGRVCMVTGATSGIGEATARALAGQGAHVLIVGRQVQRGATVVNAIRRDTDNPKVDFLLADLALLSQVRLLAGEFTRRYDRLDVLVNNAGGIFARRHETVEGIEQTWVLNYLSPFLLTHLLLDALQSSAPSRIVNVTSDAHRRGRLQFADLEGHVRYSGFGAYAQTKLALVLFTYELARRLYGTGVTVNAVYPGLVASSFGGGNGRLWDAMWAVTRRFAASSAKGAETVVHLASSTQAVDETARYWAKGKPTLSSPASYDEAAAQLLWQVSVERVGLEPERAPHE